jgi:hypothetical protein
MHLHADLDSPETKSLSNLCILGHIRPYWSVLSEGCTKVVEYHWRGAEIWHFAVALACVALVLIELGENEGRQMRPGRPQCFQIFPHCHKDHD